MRRTLGTFVDKQFVSSPSAFYRDSWNSLQSGPPVVRPKRCGNFEPLLPIEVADLGRVLSGDFLFSNGRRCSGSANQPVFSSSRYFCVTVLLELKATEAAVAEEVYEWLRGQFRFSFAYMGTPTRELLGECREVHQLLNAGFGEVQLDRALQHRAYFDHFELAA